MFKFSLSRSRFLIFITFIAIVGSGCQGEYSECTGPENNNIEILNCSECLNILLIGDSGLAGARRDKSIQALNKISTLTNYDLGFILGDNFYPSGISSAYDVRWEQDFEDLFSEELYNFPFYSVLGNHDYLGNIDAQIDYTNLSTRWRMPSRYYAKTFEYGSQNQNSVLVLFLDTNTINSEMQEADVEQLLWIEEQLQNATTDRIIVAGHHTIYSYGDHGNNPYMQSILVELFEQYGVDVYVNGHDHDVQIVNPLSDIYYVTSGAFAKSRGTNCGENSLYATKNSIAVTLHVNPTSTAILPINIDGNYDYYLEF